MENSRWLTILLIGLVLAGLVVGYFLLRNTFLQTPKSNQQQVAQAPKQTPAPPESTPADFVLGQNTAQLPPTPAPTFRPVATPIATPQTFALVSPSPIASASALRAKGNTESLPNTGIPAVLTGFFSIVAIFFGWKLRKYPNI